MTVLNARIAKLEKALAKSARGAQSLVPDEELHAVIAGIARNRANWMSAGAAQQIVSMMRADMALEHMTDAQLEAYIVVLDSRI